MPVQPLEPVPAVPNTADRALGAEPRPEDIARTAPSVPTPPGSALGLGLGRLQIRLDGPRERTTNQQVMRIAGKVTGAEAARLVLYLNDAAKEMTGSGGTFETALSLRPGRNRVRVVVQDWRGVEAEDTANIEYVPPPPSGTVAIKAPVDGHTLSADDPPFILVEGKVEDAGVSTVWLVANELRVAVRVHQGQFRHVLPITESSVRIWAESGSGRVEATPQRSDAITVRATAPGTALGAIMIDWPAGTDGLQAEVRAAWRPNAARLDAPVTTALVPFGAAANGTPPSVFYLRNLKEGVYTFRLHYRAGGAAVEVAPTLLVTRSGASSVRKLQTVAVGGAGQTALARILLPQGILWEQDEWFSGQSQSADTITKFRLPDGVAWRERKADLR